MSKKKGKKKLGLGKPTRSSKKANTIRGLAQAIAFCVTIMVTGLLCMAYLPNIAGWIKGSAPDAPGWRVVLAYVWFFTGWWAPPVAAACLSAFAAGRLFSPR